MDPSTIRNVLARGSDYERLNLIVGIGRALSKLGDLDRADIVRLMVYDLSEEDRRHIMALRDWMVRITPEPLLQGDMFTKKS